MVILNDVEVSRGGVATKAPHRSLLSGKDDFLAVDWLDQNTVIGGARSGKVLLGDIRAPLGDFALRIRFHKGIQHVRSLDDNRIVIGALNSKVSVSRLFTFGRTWFFEEKTPRSDS